MAKKGNGWACEEEEEDLKMISSIMWIVANKGCWHSLTWASKNRQQWGVVVEDDINHAEEDEEEEDERPRPAPPILQRRETWIGWRRCISDLWFGDLRPGVMVGGTSSHASQSETVIVPLFESQTRVVLLSFVPSRLQDVIAVMLYGKLDVCTNNVVPTASWPHGLRSCHHATPVTRVFIFGFLSFWPLVLSVFCVSASLTLRL